MNVSHSMKKRNSSLFTPYACLFFVHMPQRIFERRLREKEVPLICEINIWIEAEWLQSPWGCISPTIWLADRLLLFTHPIFIRKIAGIIWVGRNVGGDSVSEVFISQPIFLFTVPPCRPFFHFPLLPTHCFAFLSLFWFPSTDVTGGGWLQANVRRQIVDPH